MMLKIIIIILQQCPYIECLCPYILFPFGGLWEVKEPPQSSNPQVERIQALSFISDICCIIANFIYFLKKVVWQWLSGVNIHMPLSLQYSLREYNLQAVWPLDYDLWTYKDIFLQRYLSWQNTKQTSKSPLKEDWMNKWECWGGVVYDILNVKSKLKDNI